MGNLDKRFFVLDLKGLDSSVNLGDNLKDLIDNGLIKERINLHSGEIEYEGIDGTPHRVICDKGKVSKIVFNNNSSLKLNGIELMKGYYPEIKDLIETNLSLLVDEVNTLEDLKPYHKSDVMHLVCRDQIVSMLFLIKRN